MKKVVISILAAFYLCSSTGATVHLHYCMGKLISWSLEDKSGDECGKCGMEKDGGCCKDESTFVKNNLDQKTTESAIQLLQITTFSAPIDFVNGSGYCFFSVTESYPISHAPPLKSGIDILLHNCAFRI